MFARFVSLRRLAITGHLARNSLAGALLLAATLVALTPVAAQCNAPFDRGDADGDGMVNHYEINVGTNACLADTDGDGLNDQQEVVIHGTNPHTADSDGDLSGDWWELSVGTNPLVNENAPAAPVDPAPVDPAPAGDGDSDDDQLLDEDERNYYGTKPDVWDTDGDGTSDGAEIWNRDQGLDGPSDPLDPNG